MNSRKITSKTYFRMLAIIHAGMIAGALIFMVVAKYMNLGIEIEQKEGLFEAIPFLVPGFALAMMGVSFFLNKYLLKAAKTKPDLLKKLGSYQMATMWRAAPLQSSALLAIIAFMLTGKAMYPIIAGAVLLLILLKMPSKKRVIEELELNSEEIDLINNPNAIVAEVAG